MKTFKKITAVILAVFMLISFAACNDGDNGDNSSSTSYIREEKTRISVPKGNALEYAMKKLSVDRSYAYDVQFIESTEQIVNLIKNGETDIASLPVDAAARLANSVGGIKIIAINTIASFDFLTKGESLKGFADLKGKTVYFSKEEPAGEAVFRYVIEKNGMNAQNDINYAYTETNAELSALAKEEKIDFFVISNPESTKIILENENIKIASDLSVEWDKYNETKLAYGVVVAREEYINAHPDYIETFLMQNEISVNYGQAVDDISSNFFIENGYFEDRSTAVAVVTNSGLMFGEGEIMKETVNKVFEELYKVNPELTGGKLPAEDICHIAQTENDAFMTVAE